ncbi:MAG: tripartite tricarboxylate transporter substrate binding protein [Clostridia bacterium]|nr:tripartite tricarboxylate transporter substrate binding protein [Clostridia bacterium]
MSYRRFAKSGLILAIVFACCLLSGYAITAPEKYPSGPFEFIAPAGPGGGWDTTIRMVARVLGEKRIITQPMPVVNKPGGGGGVALAYLQTRKGDPYEVAVYSPPLLLIRLTGQTKLSYKDVTPIARLICDYGAFAVPKNSPYHTINDVMDALKKNPKSVKIAGTSSPGSMDHIQFMQAAKVAGVTNIRGIQYIPFQGGEGLASLMGGHVDLLTTGMAETVGPMESGDIRVLAITAPTRIKQGPMAKAPTLRELGINTEFVNWRGLFGPPGMPDYAVEFLSKALAEMAQTVEWKDICMKNGWDEAFLGPKEFGKFLEVTNEEYRSLLQDIGLLAQ